MNNLLLLKELLTILRCLEDAYENSIYKILIAFG